MDTTNFLRIEQLDEFPKTVTISNISETNRPNTSEPKANRRYGRCLRMVPVWWKIFSSKRVSCNDVHVRLRQNISYTLSFLWPTRESQGSDTRRIWRTASPGESLLEIHSWSLVFSHSERASELSKSWSSSLIVSPITIPSTGLLLNRSFAALSIGRVPFISYPNGQPPKLALEELEGYEVCALTGPLHSWPLSQT